MKSRSSCPRGYSMTNGICKKTRNIKPRPKPTKRNLKNRRQSFKSGGNIRRANWKGARREGIIPPMAGSTIGQIIPPGPPTLPCATLCQIYQSDCYSGTQSGYHPGCGDGFSNCNCCNWYYSEANNYTTCACGPCHTAYFQCMATCNDSEDMDIDRVTDQEERTHRAGGFIRRTGGKIKRNRRR